MKKFLALVMAMMMVLAMGTAFAEEWTGTYTPTEAKTFTEIKKTYDSENEVIVNETLSFTSKAVDGNPDMSKNLTVADLEVKNNAGTLAVTIPALDKAGIYEWVITENEGKTAGVGYSKDEVHVLVLVEYDNETHALKIANTTSYIKGVEGTDGEIVKKDTYTNTFKSGTVTVEKQVTGNMANENDEFEISVTLTSSAPIGTNVTLAGATVKPEDWKKTDGKDEWTYTSTLSNYSDISGAKTFTDLPVGVVVTVNENTEEDKMNGYTYVSTKVGNDDFTAQTIADATNAAIVVTNNKSDSIQTGFNMDNAPYMMIMALVVLAGVAMMMKRRAYND